MTHRILMLCWLVSAPIWAQADAPSQRALDFLGKVRSGKVDLKPDSDCAVSPATLPAKQSQIRRRLEKLGQDLAGSELKPLESKVDGSLAAVLVEATGGIDPRQRTVVAVALLQRENQWLAAPWPGSFSNTGLPYDAETRRRTSELELWMMQESAERAARMRDDATQTMRSKMGAKLSPDAWAAMTPPQVVEGFLRACVERDALMLAALCGGIAEEPSESWSETLAEIDALVAPQQASKFPWRWLTSSEVLRFPIQGDQDDDDAKVWSLAVLDPEGTSENPGKPALGVLDLELTNPDGQGWRMHPPNWKSDEEDGIGTTIDDDQVATFAESFNQGIPVKPEASVDAAIHALLNALDSHAPVALLERLHRADDPVLLRRSIMTAVATWKRDITSRDFLKWREVFRQESPDDALLLLHPFSSRNPDDDSLVPFYLVRQDNGWLWSAWPEKKRTQAYQDELTRQRDAWQKNWQQHLTQEATLLENLAPNAQPPDEAATRKLVSTWLAHCQSGEMLQALGLTARLNLPDSNRLLLRHLARAMQISRSKLPIPELVNVVSAGPWSLATLREIDDKGVERFPVLLTVSTPEGPRILNEFDWFSNPSRSREFLNKASLDRIAKALPDSKEPLFQALLKRQ